MQVEAAFDIAQITKRGMKYQYLVTNLDSSILPSITDILRNQPSTGRYERIKQRILSTFTDASETRLRQVRKGQLLGDQKLSRFLDHLCNLAANQCNEAILRTLFLEQLPEQEKDILAASLEQDLEKLAELTDRVTELQQPARIYTTTTMQLTQRTQITQSTSPDVQECAIAELQRQIAVLTSRLKKFNRNINMEHGHRSRAEHMQSSMDNNESSMTEPENVDSHVRRPRQHSRRKTSNVVARRGDA